jgi:hypothetical protein
MEREEHPGFIQVAFLSEGREGALLDSKGHLALAIWGGTTVLRARAVQGRCMSELEATQ